MTRNQRIGLVVIALAVAVVAFVVARPGDDDETEPASTTTQQPAQSGGDDTEANHETVQPAPAPVTRISLTGGVLEGDPQPIRAEKGDVVRIVVRSDIPDEIHLHGYDIEREAAPGKPARFRFKADVEGAFELESHAAEDAGEEPLIARVLVGPS
jgi:FtsP/CotA-like multicopper oxidase with cupredoxin domain